jgi:hypothetical protein
MVADSRDAAVLCLVMALDSELKTFYREKGFGESLGKRPRFVGVYTGCLLVPMPNIETRRRYLKYHDLHHLITNFSVGRIGEGEMSAWELGTGSMWRHPFLGRSKNLYSKQTRKLVDAGHWDSVEDLRRDVLDVKAKAGRRRFEYFTYLGISLFMHLLVAIPAVFCRYLSDARHHGVLAAMKPSVRKDLF